MKKFKGKNKADFKVSFEKYVSVWDLPAEASSATATTAATKYQYNDYYP